MRYQFTFKSMTEKQTTTYDKTSLLSVRGSSRCDDDSDARIFEILFVSSVAEFGITTPNGKLQCPWKRSSP